MGELSLNVTDPTAGSFLPVLRARLRRAAQLSREVLGNPTTVVGFVIIVLMLAMAALAPLITTPNTPDPYQMPRDFGYLNQPPGSPGAPLGTDSNGASILYGIIWGSRTSLQLSLVVVSITIVIGTAVGSIAGFVGGKVDTFLMRIVDIFLSVPELILALAIAAILGPALQNIILAIAAVYWVKYARIIRGQIIHVKQNEYVDAARVIGDSRLRIYRKDILPNAFTPVAVQATLDMGQVVLVGATLSFIGLAEAGLAEWGVMVSDGQTGISAGRWWASTFPGLMVFLWSLAFNLVGDGLRDALDPRTEGR